MRQIAVTAERSRCLKALECMGSVKELLYASRFERLFSGCEVQDVVERFMELVMERRFDGEGGEREG